MNTSWQQINDAQCQHFLGSVELIGQRWSSAVLLALARGATRFTEILASVEGLSDRMLALRLRQLGEAGLVERLITPSTPVQVRYGLTLPGRELLESLQPLVTWGQRWNPAAAGDGSMPEGAGESGSRGPEPRERIGASLAG